MAEPGPIDFEPWYREHWPRLVGSLRAITGDQELAREAAAEALSRAYVRWNRVGAMGSPAAWTYRVALNVLRRRALRSRLEQRVLSRRRQADASFPAEPNPEVWEAVRALPMRQRTAVALRYVYDLPQADIAEAMGVAPGTVAATLHKARAALSELLGDGSHEDVEVRGA